MLRQREIPACICELVQKRVDIDVSCGISVTNLVISGIKVMTQSMLTLRVLLAHR